MLDFARGGLLAALALGLLVSQGLRSCLLPFALALMIAAALRRPVDRLAQHLPRWLGALIVLTLAGLLALCGLTLLAVKLWQDIPAALTELSGAEALWPRLERLAQRLPPLFSGSAQWLLAQLQTQGSALTETLAARLTGLAGSWAAALPGRLFTLGVVLLASFYAAADWPRVRRWLGQLLPVSWRPAARGLLSRLRQGAWGWLRAQGLLMGITLAILLAGLSLLGVPGAWTAAVFIALADALPFFGSGILLVPWALLAWLQGEGELALGLFLLWALATLCRSVLEPRLIGREAGASPLATLLVLYGGFRLFGLPGLILGPVALSAVLAALR